jgi:hypothetical protein
MAGSAWQTSDALETGRRAASRLARFLGCGNGEPLIRFSPVDPAVKEDVSGLPQPSEAVARSRTAVTSAPLPQSDSAVT